MIARLAEIGIAIEAFLLVLVIANTIMLSTLLLQTKDHLSTATILFIFNILCSNVLFTASFLCLFSDLLDEKPFGQLSDEVGVNYIS
uniref:G-protein coupled receptors family 1 profile domain-containing protein n=1 Tax=Parascaris equorum TaxID=6256 RepID=A0A914RHP2_PAREQ